MPRKNEMRKVNNPQRKKPFPAFVTITETVAVEEIITKDGCIRRRACAKQMRIAQNPLQFKRLPKK